MSYGTMTPRQAIKLLDAIYEMVDTEWTEVDKRDDYLEAIDHAQDALREKVMSQLTLQNLLDHKDHKLGVAVWGPHLTNKIVNVALVCEDCQEVLADWDQT